MSVLWESMGLVDGEMWTALTGGDSEKCQYCRSQWGWFMCPKVSPFSKMYMGFISVEGDRLLYYRSRIMCKKPSTNSPKETKEAWWKAKIWK